MVEFDLTNKCQLKCNFCTFDYIEDKSDIPMNIAIKCLKDLKKCGVKSVNFTGGGEPTLHPDFWWICGYAVLLGLDVGVFTNGLKEFDPLMYAGCRWVRFSIDAGCKETFKKIKGVDGFDKTLENISKIRRDDFTTVGIGFVITPDNYQDIKLFSDISKTMDIDYVQYKPMIQNCFANGQISSKWWKEEVEPRLEEVMVDNPKAVINLYKFNDLVSDIERDYKICYGHNFCPCIGATGDVWVCTHLRNIDGYSFGNLKEASFQDIWGSNRRKEVIKKIDLTKCQQYCRNNEINKVLYQLKHTDDKGHYNFI
jgi:MoaA/NifB/PqqE/SkfB family radical SAM enzyme